MEEAKEECKVGQFRDQIAQLHESFPELVREHPKPSKSEFPNLEPVFPLPHAIAKEFPVLIECIFREHSNKLYVYKPLVRPVPVFMPLEISEKTFLTLHFFAVFASFFELPANVDTQNVAQVLIFVLRKVSLLQTPVARALFECFDPSEWELAVRLAQVELEASEFGQAWAPETILDAIREEMYEN